MSNVQQIHLGPDGTPLQTGRSSHGRWRYAFQPAQKTPEGMLPVHAALFVTQDADRLAFALTDGPAASFLGERLADFLWTRETASDDWPQNVRDWLADTGQWKNAPSGLTSFVCGRLERNIAGGRLYLAWLGMNGITLLDRLGIATTLDTVLSADEGWTPANGPEPVGMALHAYRGSLFGLDRMVIYTQAADPVGLDLPDMSSADLEQALTDWSEDCERDLAFYDLRLNPVLTQPSTVILAYRWISPDLCVLSWQPTSHATGYRVEESVSPTFESPTLLAELTDGRQVQYSFSPPPNGLHYYRVVPLNQGASGAPSDPISVVPMTLAAPVLDPIRWSDEGGYYLSWSVVPQATSYEIQTSPGSDFNDEETHIIYRGEATETYLPNETPLGYFYRVRAINVLYAPHTPSHWSSPQRATIRLEAPVFTQVTPGRISWTAVPGARQYAIHVTAKGQDEQTGETVFVIEPHVTPADTPAIYRVQAQRSPDDLRTASEWSESITLAPASLAPARRSVLPFALPVLLGAILVALLVGGTLGVAGFESIQSRRATDAQTPLPRSVIETTHIAATQNATQATAVVVLGGTKDALQATVQHGRDLEATRTRIPTITPSRTPNMTSTMGMAFANAETATAAGWTETPTPSNTPNMTSTVSVAFAGAQTATAAQWTATPTPTGTPTNTATFTPTFTHTPTDTPTHTPTPTITPNISATVSVAVAAFMAATETARPTLPPTPRPSRTPDLVATVNGAVAATLAAQPTLPPPADLSATPDWESTVAAVQTQALPAGCFLTDLPADPLPVLRAPIIGAALVYEAAPRYSIALERSAVATGQVWIKLLFAVDTEALTGWALLPTGLNEADYLHGADCPPPDHVD